MSDDFRIPKRGVVTAVTASLGLDQSDESMIATRLLMFTRLGFPAGSSVGRGYRGGYTPDQFWKLILAFQLLEMGVALSRAIAMVNESWDLAYLAISHSLPDHGDPDRSFVWLAAPAGLQEPNLDRDGPENGSWNRPILTMSFEHGQSAIGIAELANVRKYTVINARIIVQDALEALALPESGIGAAALDAAMREWASTPMKRLRQLMTKK